MAREWGFGTFKRRNAAGVVGALLLSACAAASGRGVTTEPPPTPEPEPEPETIEELGLPEPDLSGRKKLTLWATYYSIPRVRSLASGGHAMLDPQGRPLGPMLSMRDFCDAGMEGTVQVRWNGRWRTYNYAGPGPSVQVNCSPRYPRHPATGRSRFRASKKPYGEGASGARLIPFRSIAVDPRFIPHGTVLFIPAARGTPLSSAEGEKRTHDGYFFAADTGGSIRGQHIDVFLGPRGPNPFSFIGSSKKQTFDAYVIDEPDLRSLLSRAHEL